MKTTKLWAIDQLLPQAGAAKRDKEIRLKCSGIGSGIGPFSTRYCKNNQKSNPKDNKCIS